jgi:hypothetical protein
VIDQGGLPVAGEFVLIPFPHMPAYVVNGEMQAIKKTLTDQDGRFMFADLPKGQYDIVVGARGDRGFLEGVETGRTDAVFTLPATANVRVALEGFPAGQVGVRVVGTPMNSLGFRRDLRVAGTEFVVADVPLRNLWFVAVAGPYHYCVELTSAELSEISGTRSIA